MLSDDCQPLVLMDEGSGFQHGNVAIRQNQVRLQRICSPMQVLQFGLNIGAQVFFLYHRPWCFIDGMGGHLECGTLGEGNRDMMCPHDVAERENVAAGVHG